MVKIRHFGKKVFRNYLPMQIRHYIVHHATRLCIKIERITLHAGRDLPVGINIETNSLCTRSCYYCHRPTGKQTTLETETFHSIINQLKKWGFRGRISPHSYNEPLTDDRIFDLLSYAHEKLPHSELVLYTNGDLLTAETIDTLVNVGISEIEVSLHEPTSTKLENKLIELGKQYDIITLKDLRDGHRNRPLRNRGGFLDAKKIESPPFCYAVDVMVIRADGNVVLCCEDAKERCIFGNVKEEDLESIWNKPKFRKVRQDIRRGIYTLPICKECGYERLL